MHHQDQALLEPTSHRLPRGITTRANRTNKTQIKQKTENGEQSDINRKRSRGQPLQLCPISQIRPAVAAKPFESSSFPDAKPEDGGLPSRRLHLRWDAARAKKGFGHPARNWGTIDTGSTPKCGATTGTSNPHYSATSRALLPLPGARFPRWHSWRGWGRSRVQRTICPIQP
jgi:hypothetical protein